MTTVQATPTVRNPNSNVISGLDYDAQLPLTLCSLAAKGDVQGIKTMITKVSTQDLSRGDYDNRTPLHLAAEEGNF